MVSRGEVIVPFPNQGMVETLKAEGLCFGKYSAGAPECGRCTAPIFHEGRLQPVFVLCREHTQNRKSTSCLAANLRSREVQKRLAQGRSPQEILEEMAGPDPDQATLRTARQTLKNRLAYLKGQGVPVPVL